MSSHDPQQVSVVMPVYNGELFFHEAMRSILAQTYTNFEFIIINDGSTDGTKEIIESYKDPRIRVYHQENRGLPATLNRGLNLSFGEYIARMDVDDTSHPQRLEKQVAFLNAHPQIGICGTWIKLFGDGMEEVLQYPTDSASIKSSLLFHSPLAHPSIMAKRNLFGQNKLAYSSDYPCAEDYELWVRCSKLTEFSNIPEVLYYYRIHTGQETQKNVDIKSSSTERIRLNQIKELGLSPTEEELTLHTSLARFSYTPSWHFINKTHSWLNSLYHANRQARRYPEDAFARMLADRWFDVCYNARSLGFRTFIRFMRSPLQPYTSLKGLAKFKFGVKSLVKR